MDRLKDKRALITGGTTGIGLETARQFLAEGARVAITGSSPASVAAAKAELGGDVLAIPADAGDVASQQIGRRGRPGSLRRARRPVRQRRHRLFPPARRAGGGGLRPRRSPSTSRVRLFLIQALLPILANPASIVLNTSINNRIGMPNTTIYAATKAGLASLVRTLSGELVSRGIRVNAVSPGPTATPMHDKLGLVGEHLDALVAQIPAGRRGQSKRDRKGGGLPRLGRVAVHRRQRARDRRRHDQSLRRRTRSAPRRPIEECKMSAFVHRAPSAGFRASGSRQIWFRPSGHAGSVAPACSDARGDRMAERGRMPRARRRRPGRRHRAPAACCRPAGRPARAPSAHPASRDPRPHRGLGAERAGGDPRPGARDRSLLDIHRQPAAPRDGDLANRCSCVSTSPALRPGHSSTSSRAAPWSSSPSSPCPTRTAWSAPSRSARRAAAASRLPTTRR